MSSEAGDHDDIISESQKKHISLSSDIPYNLGGPSLTNMLVSDISSTNPDLAILLAKNDDLPPLYAPPPPPEGELSVSSLDVKQRDGNSTVPLAADISIRSQRGGSLGSSTSNQLPEASRSKSSSFVTDDKLNNRKSLSVSSEKLTHTNDSDSKMAIKKEPINFTASTKSLYSDNDKKFKDINNASFEEKEKKSFFNIFRKKSKGKSDGAEWASSQTNISESRRTTNDMKATENATSSEHIYRAQSLSPSLHLDRDQLAR